MLRWILTNAMRINCVELREELAAAKMLNVEELANSIIKIGFECTRCGACCKGDVEEHVATIFPMEIREIQKVKNYEWRDVARPMPFGILENEEGKQFGETFEWALKVGSCGDCTFYNETEGIGKCSIHESRPFICQTYPFSVDLEGSYKPNGNVIEKIDNIVVHECEGVGREISQEDAIEMAKMLKERTIYEIQETIQVKRNYKNFEGDINEIVIHDSEGLKDINGEFIV